MKGGGRGGVFGSRRSAFDLRSWTFEIRIFVWVPVAVSAGSGLPGMREGALIASLQDSQTTAVARAMHGWDRGVSWVPFSRPRVLTPYSIHSIARADLKLYKEVVGHMNGPKYASLYL